jgi:hypothetical protein
MLAVHETERMIAAIKDGSLATKPVTPTAIRSTPLPVPHHVLAQGFDPDGEHARQFDERRRHHRLGAEREIAAAREAAIGGSSAANATLRAAVKDREAALADFLGGNLTLIAEPFFIWSTPGLYFDAQTSPYASTAKFTVTTGDTIDETLTFWYYWVNPSDGVAVLDVSGFLTTNGFVQVSSEGGTFPGWRNSHVQLVDELHVLNWWQQPATEPMFQDSQDQVPITLGVDSGGWFASDAFAATPLFAGRDMSFSSFLVPGRSTAVFQMSLRVRTLVSDGSATIDFASGDFAVTSPWVLVNVLS